MKHPIFIKSKNIYFNYLKINKLTSSIHLLNPTFRFQKLQ